MKSAPSLPSIQSCLGENIRRLRQSRGLTQKQFAAELKLSLSFLHNLEAGKKWVGPASVKKIAAAFQVSEAELFTVPVVTEKPARPDPHAALLWISEAFGIDLPSEAIYAAPFRRRPLAHARFFEAIPPEVETHLCALREHPQWDWASFHQAMQTWSGTFKPAAAK